MGGIETEDRCPQCGASVVWRRSVLGTRLRLDAAPNPAGNVIIVDLEGKARAKVLTGAQMPAQQEAWRRHQCPQPLRGKHCGRVMAPADLFLALGWDDHPGCDPADWL